MESILNSNMEFLIFAVMMLQYFVPQMMLSWNMQSQGTTIVVLIFHYLLAKIGLARPSFTSLLLCGSGWELCIQIWFIVSSKALQNFYDENSKFASPTSAKNYWQELCRNSCHFHLLCIHQVCLYIWSQNSYLNNLFSIMATKMKCSSFVATCYVLWLCVMSKQNVKTKNKFKRRNCDQQGSHWWAFFHQNVFVAGKFSVNALAMTVMGKKTSTWQTQCHLLSYQISCASG